jgi:hypothetical protein
VFFLLGSPLRLSTSFCSFLFLQLAEKWLRAEIEEQRVSKKSKKLEEASGEGAFLSASAETTKEGSAPFLNGGGFAPGRMLSRYA